jgi:hypothetical protein
MKAALPEMVSGTPKLKRVIPKTKAGTPETLLGTPKMILGDGFWVKNGKKPGFSEAAGTDWCANSNGTDLKRAV